MGIAQDIKRLQDQMKTVMDLLKNPNKDAASVLYLVRTIEHIEAANLDLSHKWNCAAAYIQGKSLEEEYNAWVTKLEGIQDPAMQRLFMLTPIDQKNMGTPTAPKLCGHKSPGDEKLTCMDVNGHTGDEHIGVDENGVMFHWTNEKDLGLMDVSEVPTAPGPEPSNTEQTNPAPDGETNEELEDELEEDPEPDTEKEE